MPVDAPVLTARGGVMSSGFIRTTMTAALALACWSAMPSNFGSPSFSS